MKKLSNEYELDVIDQDGNLVETRVLHNVPVVELAPDENLVLIDWRAADNIKPTLEQLMSPVSYNGASYHGAWMWGSSVKKCFTIGAEHDLPKVWGHTFDEDAMRFMRLLLGEGVNGGLVATKDDPLRVKVVKAGKMVNDRHPIQDGFGYIRRSVAEAGMNDNSRIALSFSRDSAQFAQRLPLSVLGTLMPSIKNRLDVLCEPGSRGMSTLTQLHEKQQWVKLDNDMVKHPYVANALDRTSSDAFARGCMSVPTNSKVRVAVPANVRRIATDVPLVAYRYPIDAWGSIQAVEAEGSAAELSRIGGMEVIQFTLANRGFYASGCFGVLDDDEMPDGVDIVVCADNIKLRVGNPNKRKRVGMIDFEGVLTFNQWFDAGSAVGIGYKWFSEVMGGDFDGDLLTFFGAEDCGQDEFDAMFTAIRAFPKQGSPKMLKSKIRMSEGGRARFALNSMINLVGFASNLQASTFSVTDREALALGIGFKSTEAMDDYFRQVMALAVDGYKSSKVYIERNGRKVLMTIPQTEENLGRIQTKIVGFLGGLAPWNSWTKSETWFKHQVPFVIEQTIGQGMYKVAGRREPIYLDKRERKGSVRPVHDTLIAEIARVALPALAHEIGTTVAVRPLAYFKRWAPESTEAEIEAAAEYVDWYTYNAPRVSWSDGAAVQSFKNRCRIRFKKFVAEHEQMTEDVALAAIWHRAHSSRSSLSGAGAPFMAAPEIAARFVTEKPGLKTGKFSAVLVGLRNQMAEPLVSWAGKVTVEEREVLKNGRKKYRLFVKPVDATGLFFAPKAADDQYPEGYFGMLSEQSAGVKEGQYEAVIEATSARSASIMLTG